MTANADSYTSPVGALPASGTNPAHSAVLHIAPPGLLANDTDTSKHALSVVVPGAPPTCSGPGTCTVSLQSDGSFTATMAAAGNYTFSYTAKNSQGTSSAAANVSVAVPGAAISR